MRYDRRRMLAAARRADAIASPDREFLAEIAAEEIAFRVAAANRDFREGIDWLSVSPALARRLRRDRPGLRLAEFPWRARLEGGIEDAGPRQASCDLFVSLLGLHRCEDPAAEIAAARQALRPDGLFLAAILGDGTLGELAESMMAAELASEAGAALRVEPFATLVQAGAWLQQAGLALPVVDIERLTLRYRDLASLLRDLHAAGGGSALAGPRRPLRRSTVGALESCYRARFADADGKLRATVNLLFMSGWAPHESQQRPLRPGSAKARLADALKPPPPR